MPGHRRLGLGLWGFLTVNPSGLLKLKGLQPGEPSGPAVRAERIFSRELVAGLNCLADRPWMELRKGKAITESWLAQRLRPYGIRPRTIWCGELSAKGYGKEDFGEVFRRYIPQSEVEELLAESTMEGPPQPKELNR